MDTEENPLLIAALAYASKGWKVFPVYEPLPDGSCSCLKNECKHVGKHPRTSHGFKDATTCWAVSVTPAVWVWNLSIVLRGSVGE